MEAKKTHAELQEELRIRISETETQLKMMHLVYDLMVQCADTARAHEEEQDELTDPEEVKH